MAEVGSSAQIRIDDVPAAPPLILKPRRGWSALQLREVWAYRELLYFLTWRDILVRYKQAVLGVAWAVLQPFVTMVVFTVIFGKLLHVGTGSAVPYAIFSYTGLLPWNLFSGSLSRAGTSVVGSANLVTKVYFPRLIIPVSSVLAGVVDFAIAFIVLLGLMPYYHIAYSWQMLAIPGLVVLCLLTALSVAIWLSALNVMYRDVQYLIPFLVQLWMYISPVIYPISKVPPGPLRTILMLNPMTGVIQGFRWAILGDPAPDGLLAITMSVVAVLFVTGLFYFKRMERSFADVV